MSEKEKDVWTGIVVGSIVTAMYYSAACYFMLSGVKIKVKG